MLTLFNKSVSIFRISKKFYPAPFVLCQKKAFSLTELLVVMSIIVVLLSIGMKAQKKFSQGASFETTVSLVRSMLHRTREMAKGSGIPAVFNFRSYIFNGERVEELMASKGQLQFSLNFETAYTMDAGGKPEAVRGGFANSFWQVIDKAADIPRNFSYPKADPDQAQAHPSLAGFTNQSEDFLPLVTTGISGDGAYFSDGKVIGLGTDREGRASSSTVYLDGAWFLEAWVKTKKFDYLGAGSEKIDRGSLFTIMDVARTDPTLAVSIFATKSGTDQNQRLELFVGQKTAIGSSVSIVSNINPDEKYFDPDDYHSQSISCWDTKTAAVKDISSPFTVPNFPIGQWMRVGVFYDSINLYLFINGQLWHKEHVFHCFNASETGDGYFNTGTSGSFGRSIIFVGGGGFVGAIDEVRLYNFPRDIYSLNKNSTSRIGGQPKSDVSFAVTSPNASASTGALVWSGDGGFFNGSFVWRDPANSYYHEYRSINSFSLYDTGQPQLLGQDLKYLNTIAGVPTPVFAATQAAYNAAGGPNFDSMVDNAPREIYLVRPIQWKKKGVAYLDLVRKVSGVYKADPVSELFSYEAYERRTTGTKTYTALTGVKRSFAGSRDYRTEAGCPPAADRAGAYNHRLYPAHSFMVDASGGLREQ